MDVQAKCWDDMPWYFKVALTVTLACTVVDLDAGTCTIYRFTDKLSDDLDAHEKGHCKGGAHDNGWQEYFDAWKAKQKGQ